jgi:predicted nucleotidyltransferase component of viral defense system
MSPDDAARWKSALLDQIFVALAASERLDECLIFKGARVLNVRLGGGRQSLDLDSNLDRSFVDRLPDREEQRAFLEQEIAGAIRRHFERQEPVVYDLMALTVRTYPPRSHPMGWDAFKVRINVNDRRRDVLNFPALEIDVAAPEELLDSSVSEIVVGGHRVHAYTLERITGEKLRAYLSSLPAYRAKVRKPGEAVRAKDLYDLAHVRRICDITQVDFWRLVGQEFQIACRSRYIDCAGLVTFQEQWEVTRGTYEQATIPNDIPFEEAEATLVEVVDFLHSHRFLPFTFPLPQETTNQG